MVFSGFNAMKKNRKLVFTVVSVLFSLLSITLAAKPVTQQGTGKLVEYSLVKNFPAEELKAFFKLYHIPKVMLPVNVGIRIYEVIYTTTYADNSIIKASGLVYVPMSSTEELPVMIYNHGTEICRERNCKFTGEQTICLAFATDKYIVMTPDYVGLGRSEKNQLYLHASTEAHASVDMLLAVKQLLPQLNVKASKQLFVTGYSQGGHAAMATTKLLQDEYSAQLPVTASSPMSGPYNIEGTVYDGRNQEYNYPGFLFLLLQSYFESRGDYKSLSNILNPPYDTLIPPLLDGNYPIQEIDKLLPNPVFKAIKKSFYDDFENNPESDFRKYLKSNNLYDWKPEMPMMLGYCNADEEVTYKNSTLAYETMKRNGSKSVELWRVGKKFGHVNCALFAVIYTKMFFDGFRDGHHPGSHGPAFKRLLLNLGKLGVKSGVSHNDKDE
jgi:hypothetical protein